MFEVTTPSAEHWIKKFDTLEEAQTYAQKLVDDGWFIFCRIYQNEEWLEDIA